MSVSRLVPLLFPLAAWLLLGAQPGAQTPAISTPAPPSPPAQLFGFRDPARQAIWDEKFLAVPDPALARQHLKALTSAPHWASSPEDYATALYVAARFKAAGLETQIVPYSVLTSKPSSTLIEAFDAAGQKIFTGPTPEHLTPRPSDPPDPRIIPPFNAWSPSGDITAPIVYANYGRVSDFQRLADLGIPVKGRIILVRNGGIFRGVKVYIAQQRGAKGVLIFSDPSDDNVRNKPAYPEGTNRPDSAVQRGSVQFMPLYPGDPTTPGIASVPNLPSSARIPAGKLQYDLPSIPVQPLSSADAASILRALAGPSAPRDWQGGLGFAYRLGAAASPVTVHMQLVISTSLRTIWDVIGRIPGASDPAHWVIAGNHRDAWVYGAADPGSGTAAMLEAVHGLGELLHQGWRPRRTILIASWDAEEEGLIGSTEWVEQNLTAPQFAQSARAVAYFNTDVAVSGPSFNAGAVPSLRRFLIEIAKEVPSPAGGTVFEQWQKEDNDERPAVSNSGIHPPTPPDSVVRVGDLGSGSDYSPFLQHAGVPSTDIGSDGPYGVYHTPYDNYDWFARFADPDFAYTQQQARVLGLEVLHMADADALPYDYPAYAEQIHGYLDQARNRAAGLNLKLDFAAAMAASDTFTTAAGAAYQLQLTPPANLAPLNTALVAAERALLLPAGLPRRPWYRHSIYAPGEFTGYEAVVIPGVNEAIDAGDIPRAQSQLAALAAALTRAASALSVHIP